MSIKYIRTIFQFIGRTLNEFVLQKEMQCRIDKIKVLQIMFKKNVSFVDLRDEAQILNRVPMKFEINESLQTFVNAFTK